MTGVLAILQTIIAPLEQYAEQKLASIGAAFLSAMAVIFNSFTNDQRQIATQCTAFWQAKYHAAVTAGASPLNAAEQASTATLNEFVKEESAEGAKIVSLITSALELSVLNSFPKSA